MYRLLIITLLVACIGACTNTQPQTTSKTEPDVPELLDRKAELRQGKEWDHIQSAYAQQLQKLRQNPYDGEARLILAQLFANEARITGEHGHYFPAALQMTTRALQSADLDKDVRFRLLTTHAAVQLSQHDFRGALKTAEEAVALNPYNAQIYGALADAYVELGEYEKAVEMADKMVSIRPDLRSYSRVSYLREIHGDLDGAIQAMDMAAKAGAPGYEATAWARLTLGELYETAGKPEAAEEQYRLILAERPNYPFATAALAKLEKERGNLAGAERLWNEAARVIPEVGFYIDLAHLYKETGRTADYEKAKTDILAMLRDDVDSGHNMDMEYAVLYLELFDDYDQALTYAQNEWQKRPDNIDVNRLLARIYHARGEETEARRHLEAAARTQSRHPELAELRQQLAMVQ